LTSGFGPWQISGVRIRVRLFASLRDTVGRREVEIELGPGATPEEAWARLAEDHPGLGARRASLAASVNRRYAPFDTVLADGDELAFIPPVSGG
jgi:molybdopterin converting factor subunit 1